MAGVPAQNPDDATALQSFTAAELPAVEAPLDGAGALVTTALGELAGATAEAESIGAALVTAADLLTTMSAEEEGITLVGEVASAVALDEFLQGLS